MLAAGSGSRLAPLSDLRAKALCPVAGVALLDHALHRLLPHAGSGPGHLAVNAHAHAPAMAVHIGDRAHLSLERPTALGTAGALGRLRSWLDGRHVLVTNADAWLPGGLAPLMSGWDTQRVRLLGRDLGRPSDFGSHRYVGAALLPWSSVRALRPEPSGLYEVMWRRAEQEGRLEVVEVEGTAIDCGTPRDYLAANLDASGGRSVVGTGAVVHGRLTRSVVWDGAYVEEGEHLVDVVRAGDREHPMTVEAH